MYDKIPGYVLRDRDGNLSGYQCPLSKRSFYGANGERDQYEFTKAIMEQQGDGIAISQRKQLYEAQR